MNNLVIGNTSQLAYFFPEDYEKISSRNIDFSQFKNKFYNRIYFCFAEQRTFMNKSNDFIDINVSYTLELMDFFKSICNEMIIYGTCELWNKYSGGISLDMAFNYEHSDYIYSKELLIKSVKDRYYNVIVIHPFNFNSVYRKGGFLFGKIFDSIINEKKIQIGSTYFYRDLVHPKYVVERSILAEGDELVGSGRLTHVNDFIRNLYEYFHLDYFELVEEDKKYVDKKIFYLKSTDVLYSTLFEDTVNDMKIIKKY